MLEIWLGLAERSLITQMIWLGLRFGRVERRWDGVEVCLGVEIWLSWAVDLIGFEI